MFIVAERRWILRSTDVPSCPASAYECALPPARDSAFWLMTFSSESARMQRHASESRRLRFGWLINHRSAPSGGESRTLLNVTFPAPLKAALLCLIDVLINRRFLGGEARKQIGYLWIPTGGTSASSVERCHTI